MTRRQRAPPGNYEGPSFFLLRTAPHVRRTYGVSRLPEENAELWDSVLQDPLRLGTPLSLSGGDLYLPPGALRAVPPTLLPDVRLGRF